MATHRLIARRVEPKYHVETFERFIEQAAPRDTIEIDGWLELPKVVRVRKPVNVRKFGDEGGIRLIRDAEIVVGPGLPDLVAESIPMLGATERQSYIDVPENALSRDATIAIKDYLFCWSLDALTGLTPHMNGMQLPGECHQVVAMEPVAGGKTLRCYLAEGLRDFFMRDPRLVVLRAHDDWRHLRWDIGLQGVDRTIGRALEAEGIPDFELRAEVDGAGDLMIQCPRAKIDALIHGQADPINHYGVVMGPWSSDFDVAGRGAGCRHVFTTSGNEVEVLGKRVRCGSPWGRVGMRASGRYLPVLETHAEGRGIIFDRCHVEVVPTRERMSGTGIKIRSRDAVVRDCVVIGADPRDAGIIGVTVWAAGCRIERLRTISCWRNHTVTEPGTVTEV